MKCDRKIPLSRPQSYISNDKKRPKPSDASFISRLFVFEQAAERQKTVFDDTAIGRGREGDAHPVISLVNAPGLELILVIDQDSAFVGRRLEGSREPRLGQRHPQKRNGWFRYEIEPVEDPAGHFRANDRFLAAFGVNGVRFAG